MIMIILFLKHVNLVDNKKTNFNVCMYNMCIKALYIYIFMCVCVITSSEETYKY